MSASERQRLMIMGLLATALIAFTVPTSAQEQSVIDQVDECDSLAAHPGDPERLAEGVADDAIVPRLAITACESAAQRSPGEARFAFQLGRAYSAVRRRADAAVQFKKAADQGYGAALAYLGDAYQFGYGVEVSVEKAIDAYRKAAAKGFFQADGQIEMLTFDPRIFTNPVVAALYSVEVLSMDQVKDLDIQAYLFSFVQTLSGECNALLNPAAVVSLYRRRFPKDWRQDAETPNDDQASISNMTAYGEYDGKTFLRRHGCDGPIATRVKRKLNSLYLNQ